MKWRRISETLPQNYGNYIVCLKNGSVMEFTFSNIGGNLWLKPGIGRENIENPVTYWMPMPKPPIEVMMTIKET